jgi:hypothetical protein
MSIPLVVNGDVFQYPQNRDPAGWGPNATGWAQAVTTVLGSLNGPADILNTVATVANNQTTSLPNIAGIIPGLSFDPTIVKGARVDYNVYRNTSTNELVEQGIMLISYKPIAATWDLVIQSSQTANITFSISSTGQLYYTTDNMPGTNYSGTITFRAIALT